MAVFARAPWRFGAVTPNFKRLYAVNRQNAGLNAGYGKITDALMFASSIKLLAFVSRGFTRHLTRRAKKQHHSLLQTRNEQMCGFVAVRYGFSDRIHTERPGHPRV